MQCQVACIASCDRSQSQHHSPYCVASCTRQQHTRHGTAARCERVVGDTVLLLPKPTANCLAHSSLQLLPTGRPDAPVMLPCCEALSAGSHPRALEATGCTTHMVRAISSPRRIRPAWWARSSCSWLCILPALPLPLPPPAVGEPQATPGPSCCWCG